jgi:hypothetical protein
MLDLRLDAEKEGVGNRNDPLARFVNKWSALLDHPDQAWEGPLATAELRRKQVLTFLHPRGARGLSWHLRDLFGTLLEEMKLYRDEALGRLLKEYYRDAHEFLKRETIKIQKRRHKTRLPDIKAVFQSVEEQMKRAEGKLSLLEQRRRQWRYGASEHLWHDVPRQNLVEGKPQLDTRLQTQMGKILFDYLFQEHVTIETIARLIVMAYCAGELAEWDREAEALRTTFTHRSLTVRNVRDLLRRRKLVKSYAERLQYAQTNRK